MLRTIAGWVIDKHLLFVMWFRIRVCLHLPWLHCRHQVAPPLMSPPGCWTCAMWRMHVQAWALGQCWKPRTGWWILALQVNTGCCRHAANSPVLSSGWDLSTASSITVMPLHDIISAHVL